MKTWICYFGLLGLSYSLEAASRVRDRGEDEGESRNARVWDTLDPASGKKISPNTVLSFPDGKTVKASVYYAELNEHEKFLNEQGQSLYDEPDDLGFVAIEVSKKNLLNAQLVAFDRPLSKVKTATVLLPLQDPPSIMPACNSEDRYHKYEPWNKFVGNDRFSIGLNAEIVLDASCTSSKAKAETSFAAKAFFITYNVATAKISTQSDGPIYRYDYSFLVAGFEVKADSGTSQNPLNLSDTRHRDFAKSGSFSYPIGPIRATIRFGIKGEVGVQYALLSSNLSARGQVGPFANLDAFLEGGINAVIVEGGVGGELNLVDVVLNANGLVELSPRQGELYFHSKIYGDYRMDALDGRLYAYVKVKVPAFRWPPYKIKQYSVDVANWDGLHTHGELFNREIWEQLN